MRASFPSAVRRTALFVCLLPVACTLEPEGTGQAFERMVSEGAPWTSPPGVRELPELPDPPGRDDLVARALLANGRLEAAWHAWRAALEGVLVASGWPNTDLAVGLTAFAVNGGAWDTSAVTLGFDPMAMLLLPDKVRAAGRAAFERALATGHAFEQTRLELREDVVRDHLAWALLAERLRITHEEVDLRASLERQARAAVVAGAAQSGLIARQVELLEARVALSTLEGEVAGLRARLNARCGRPLDAPLALPDRLPEPDPLDEVRLDALDAGLLGNPRLAGLRHEAGAAQELLALAELRDWPNLAPSAQASGGGPESLGVMVTLPTTTPAVRAAVRQATAARDAADAALRQASRDERAEFVATLSALRADERVAALLVESVEPAAQAAERILSESYAHGVSSLVELVDAQLALLELRRLVAEARISRERRLVALERLGGVDLGRPAPPRPSVGAPSEEEP